MDLSDVLAQALEREQNAHCANCSRDRSIHSYADWRIIVQAEEVYQPNRDWKPDPNPMPDGPLYFCNLDCLRNWAESRGPW